MITVHKFQLARGLTTLQLPMLHQPIHAGLDPSGQACVWIRLDNSAPFYGARKFWNVGTGQNAPAPNEGIHISTFNQGPYVAHVFAAVWP